MNTILGAKIKKRLTEIFRGTLKINGVQISRFWMEAQVTEGTYLGWLYQPHKISDKHFLIILYKLCPRIRGFQKSIPETHLLFEFAEEAEEMWLV